MNVYLVGPGLLGIGQNECHSGATLSSRIAGQHYQGGWRLLHDASETKPGSQGYSSQRCFVDASEIKSDESKPAILDKDISCLECLLQRF